MIMPPVEVAPASRFTFIDLFAGLGGFHQALTRVGGRAVFAAEWVTHLAALYEKNYGLMPWGDINAVDVDSVPHHDVLTAGFPCQPFSKAGEQLGFRHTEQGQLFFAVERILRAKRPSYFILENVPNLLTHANGQTMATMLRALKDLGYEVAFSKLSPHNFGIPQIRDRVYIVGSTRGMANFQWPAPTDHNGTVHDILDETEPRDTLPPSVLQCIEVWDDFLSRVPDTVRLPSFPLWSMEWGADYPAYGESPYVRLINSDGAGLEGFYGSAGVAIGTGTVEEQLLKLPSHARRPLPEFPRWKSRFIEQNRQFYSDNKKWIDPWIHRVRPLPSSYQKFEWNAGDGERSIYKYVLQMRASGLRVKRPTTSPSLIAMTPSQVPIIGWAKRYLTPRESARLQSLGDIELPQLPKDAYKALGNAVNAEVVRRIASSLLDDVRVDVDRESVTGSKSALVAA